MTSSHHKTHKKQNSNTQKQKPIKTQHPIPPFYIIFGIYLFLKGRKVYKKIEYSFINTNNCTPPPAKL